MQTLKPVNNYVFVIRDAVKSEVGGIMLPSEAKVKPHRGVIFGIGGKVTDPEIKRGKDKTALFHQGIGFEMEVELNSEKKTFLVLQEHEIIAVI